MKRVSCLMYELTWEETKELPEGFPVLEYDSLYGSLRVLQGTPRRDKRYVYLAYREPPTGLRKEVEEKRMSG